MTQDLLTQFNSNVYRTRALLIEVMRGAHFAKDDQLGQLAGATSEALIVIQESINKLQCQPVL